MKKFLTYVIMLFLTLGVQAATFLVNSFPDDFPDSNPGDGYCHITVFDPVEFGEQCTLRAAVMEANAQLGEDAIVLPLGVEIKIDTSTAIPENTNDPIYNYPAGYGALAITESVLIMSADGVFNGAGVDKSQRPVIKPLKGNGGLFSVAPGITIFHLEDVIIRGWEATNFGVDSSLLTIRPGAHVNLINSDFIDNINGKGPAIRTMTYPGDDVASLYVEDSRFMDNIAYGLGGAIHLGSETVASFKNSVFKRNMAAGEGTAIHSLGALTITESTIIDNKILFSIGSSKGAAVYAGIDDHDHSNSSKSLSIVNTTVAKNYPTGVYANGVNTHVEHATFKGHSRYGLRTVDTHVHEVNLNLMSTVFDDNKVNCAAPNVDVVSGFNLYFGQYNVGCKLLFNNDGNIHADPMLSEIKSFGFHQYFIPEPGSKAHNNASPLDCPYVDQIGNMRTRECDIGAIEAVK